VSNETPLLNDPQFVADLENRDLTGATISRKWGIAKSAVNKWRRRLTEPVPDPLAIARAPKVDAAALTGKVDVGPDGGEFVDVQTTEVITDWSDVFRRFNLDPDSFEVVGGTVRMSTWQQSKALEDGTRDVVNLFSYRATFRRIRQDDDEFASILDRIKSFTYVPAPVAFNPVTQVVVPCDLQVGKVDWNGNTDDTVEQALESFAKAAEFAREFRPAELCLVDAGDPIENIYNTASQLGTNDSDLPRQIEVAHNIFLTGIEMLAPLVPSLRYAAVSSNHGQQRLGPKSPAGDAHADYGLGIAKMIRRALELNPSAFRHVTVQTPDPYMESLYFRTSGSDVGVVHGHQAGQADKLGEWWKGQSHGNMPVAKARILIAGHFHSLRYYQSGDSRHVFVGPASDRGSSWFTNLRGESSQSGMLMFTTHDNTWDDLRVL
jgi:hypothetical protein